MIDLWREFLHVTGSDNTSGVWYGFWSGFGSDITELFAIAMVLKWVNCHEPGCFRLGIHPHKHFKFCKRHHPLIGAKK